MQKLSALVLIALFLGGIGTGVGGYAIYQIATGTFGGSQGPPGPPGTPGPYDILNGVYEGEHIFGTALIPANASVILRNGDFYGAGIYIYGNLTVENSNLYQRLWPLGEAVVTLNNTLWEAPDLEVYWLTVRGNASVTFYNRFGAAIRQGFNEQFTLLCWENSTVTFVNATTESPIQVYLYEQSSGFFMNNSSIYELNTFDSTRTWMHTGSTISQLIAHHFSKIYLYLSEGGSIAVSSLHDAAQIINL